MAEPLPVEAGDRLEWTGAVTEIEGAAGGGLVPWALIGGLGTDAASWRHRFRDLRLDAGFHAADRPAPASMWTTGWKSRRHANASMPVRSFPDLTLGQDIIGLKIRLAGDAVFAPDQWLPQIALGAQWKRTLDFEGIPRAVGAARGEDVDIYLAATKVYFAALGGPQPRRRCDPAADPSQSVRTARIWRRRRRICLDPRSFRRTVVDRRSCCSARNIAISRTISAHFAKTAPRMSFSPGHR